MKRYTKAEKKRIYRIILITFLVLCGGLAFALICKKGFYIPCIFNKITGLYCPGCGNTRAALALLSLNFSAMLHYNILFIFEALYILMVYFVAAFRYIKGEGFSYRSPFKPLDYAFLVILIVWTVIRNICPIFHI